MSDLLTTDEVADRLRVKPRFVRELLASKQLRGSRIGGEKRGEWRVSAEDLQRYIDAKANVSHVRKKAS